MTQMTMATGASLQFKTVTQMTQMTQWPPAGWRQLAARNMRHSGCAAAAAGHAGNTHNASRGMGRAGGKGLAKTVGLRTIFFYCVESSHVQSMESLCSIQFHLHRARCKRQSRA